MICAEKRTILNQPLDEVQLTFTRNSVAYDWQGNEVPANTPRFEHRVPDITVTNLLAGNQSDGGDTLNPELLSLNQRTGTDALGDTTGFTAIGTTPAVITSSTAQFHSGSKSLSVDCAGDAAGEGVETAATTISNATAYIGGAWVYAPNGATMEISLYTDAESTPVAFTGTGAWQWVDTGAITSGTTTAKILIKTRTSGQAITFYVDDLRLGKNNTTGFTSYDGGNGTTTISITPETSYTGFRCVKVTNNGFTNQGVQLSVAQGTQNNSMTFTAVVKGNAGVKLRLRMYQITTGWLNDTSFTANGEWQKISLTNTFPISGATWVYVSTDEAITTTFYVDQLMLETGSTAHDWAYGRSSYSTYKTEYGCLIEEAHTNLLTANQSTAGDISGNHGGFSNGAFGGTISYQTVEKFQGNGCVKCVTTGTNISEGMLVQSTSTTSGLQYYATAWVKFPKGVPFYCSLLNGGTYNYYTGTGDWQQIGTGMTATTNYTQLRIYVPTQYETIFYADMFQFTQTAYPLSWTLGGTTQAVETLTAPSSVLNIDTNGYSNLLTPNQADGTDTLGTTDGFLNRNNSLIGSDSTEFYQGKRSLKCVCPGSVVDEGVVTLENAAVNGVTYTITTRIKAPVGATLKIYNAYGFTNYTGTGNWDLVTLTVTSTGTTINIRIATVTSAQAITFYVDELQLTATSTAKPWIPGGTQVNTGSGTIEMEVLVNNAFKNNAVSRYIMLHTTSLGRSNIVIGKNNGDILYAGTTNENVNVTYTGSRTGSQLPLGLMKISFWYNASGCKILFGALSDFKNNLKMPNTRGVLSFLSDANGLASVNTIIRNIVISRPKRADADVTVRASRPSGKGFGIDRQVTLYAPLMHNLKAYKMARVG